MISWPTSLSLFNKGAGRWHIFRRSSGRGFTLLEIMIVLVIISVLAVVAMPVVSSMMREAQMREPVERLQELAKSVRLRAMLEGYPYEIIFTSEGFEGRRFQLRSDDGEVIEDEEAEGGTDEKEEAADEETEGEEKEDSESSEDKEEVPELRLPELESYRFTPPMACRLLFWGRTRWHEPPIEAEKERTAVHDRWIFQPSGISNPLRVQFYREDAWVEVAFNPLTADIQSESSLIPD